MRVRTAGVRSARQVREAEEEVGDGTVLVQARPPQLNAVTAGAVHDLVLARLEREQPATDPRKALRDALHEGLQRGNYSRVRRPACLYILYHIL